MDKVQEIAEAIGLSTLTLRNCIRIGKKGDSDARPMKITVNDAKQQKEVLKHSGNLKDHPTLSDIGISPDLTAEQRKDRKKLVEELRKRRKNGEKGLGIRNNKVVKLPARDQQKVASQPYESSLLEDDPEQDQPFQG